MWESVSVLWDVLKVITMWVIWSPYLGLYSAVKKLGANNNYNYGSWIFNYLMICPDYCKDILLRCNWIYFWISIRINPLCSETVLTVVQMVSSIRYFCWCQIHVLSRLVKINPDYFTIIQLRWENSGFYKSVFLYFETVFGEVFLVVCQMASFF